MSLLPTNSLTEERNAHPLTEEQVLAALRQVMDPELGLNVVDLGLIYSVALTPAGRVSVTMTLTTMACPLQAGFRQAVEATLWQALPAVTGVQVDIVWDPPWNPSMISAAGRAQLGMR
ncbi:MAG: metal-sulfur cluster assembly factor [Caldilineaceae bacterium]|nr:metal-sulfur cluster assembly factor [Caldilineaceae bacterium]